MMLVVFCYCFTFFSFPLPLILFNPRASTDIQLAHTYVIIQVVITPKYFMPIDKWLLPCTTQVSPHYHKVSLPFVHSSHILRTLTKGVGPGKVRAGDATQRSFPSVVSGFYSDRLVSVFSQLLNIFELLFSLPL